MLASESPDRQVYRLPLPIAIAAAVVGGALYAAAFEPLALWAVAFLAVPCMIASVLGRGFWAATALGFVSGATFWLLHIDWLSLYLGPVPWIALAVVMALFFAVGQGVTGWFSRRFLSMDRTWAPAALPLMIACVWTAREVISSRWPYGGFPWGRLALSQANSTAVAATSWIGISGLSLAIVFAVSVPVVLLWRRLSATPLEIDRNLHEGSRVGLGIVAALVTVAMFVTPAWGALAARSAPTVRVAAVQGNANAGLFAEHAPGEWLQNHLDAFEQSDASGFDIMVWPENASDLDPLRNADARAAIDALVERTGVPLVFGTITKRGDEYFNTSMLWKPGTGLADFYDKIHPVPFAEYMPDRDFFHALAPGLVDMVRYGYTFGTQDSRFEAAGVVLAPNICFEIAYDELLANSVREGAGVILAQTNNADFGYSSESAQQLAIAHVQSVALGRSVVNISTVGHSAVFGPSGDVLASVPWYTPAVMVVDVPIVYAISPGTVVGPLVEFTAVGVVVLVGLLMAIFAARDALRLRATHSGPIGGTHT